jgi:hypothetical protein
VSLLRPWVIGCAVLVAVSGALRRPRGGRLSWVTDLLDSPVAPVAPWLFVAGTLLMLTIYLRWAWGRGGVAQARGLVAGAAVSWLLCVHVPVIWLTRGLGEGEVPAVLRSHALRARPRAPLGVVVPQVSPFSRPYYEAAFRSDHLVWFLRPEEAPAWAQAHPDGFLLTRKSDPHPEAAPVARAGPWQIWEPATWGPAPRDPAATGKAQ